MKIPHLYEINPFDNTEKVYESISGYTVENWSSETLGINYFLLSLLDGLQGLMVAIAFCYRNGEVILT